MTNHGKSIELYLADGTVGGLVVAELSNWNGKALKIARDDVAGCARADIQGEGGSYVEKTDSGSGTYCPDLYIADVVLQNNISSRAYGKRYGF